LLRTSPKNQALQFPPLYMDTMLLGNSSAWLLVLRSVPLGFVLDLVLVKQRVVGLAMGLAEVMGFGLVRALWEVLSD